MGFTEITVRAAATAHLYFYSLLSLSVILYRISPWHPLASYPGPILARITKLWGFGVAYRGKLYEELQVLHEKHGPFVRIGALHVLLGVVEVL